MELPRVLIRVKLDESWLKLVCLVVPDIGIKAHLEPMRFERLVSSFGLLPHQFDTSSGPIGLLLGLSEQMYGTSRIGSFISSEFPKVGIYTSPLLSEIAYLFVGVIEDTTAAYSTDCLETESFRTGTFDVERSLHHFLESEKSVPLIDLKCSDCL